MHYRPVCKWVIIIIIFVIIIIIIIIIIIDRSLADNK